MKTIYNVEDTDELIVLSNGGFSINPQNFLKMGVIKKKIVDYFEMSKKTICSNHGILEENNNDKYDRGC